MRGRIALPELRENSMDVWCHFARNVLGVQRVLASLSFLPICTYIACREERAGRRICSTEMPARCRDHRSSSPISRRNAGVRTRKTASHFRCCVRRPSCKSVGPTRSIGRRSRRSREGRMRPNVHGQEHRGNVIRRTWAPNISTADRAGRPSMALEPARHVERPGP
jgi:hypothetical protein